MELQNMGVPALQAKFEELYGFPTSQKRVVTLMRRNGLRLLSIVLKKYLLIPVLNHVRQIMLPAGGHCNLQIEAALQIWSLDTI